MTVPLVSRGRNLKYQIKNDSNTGIEEYIILVSHWAIW